MITLLWLRKHLLRNETKAIYMFYCFFIDYLYVAKKEKRKDFFFFGLIFYCVKLNMIIATLKGLMWVERFIEFCFFLFKSISNRKKDEKRWSNFNIYLMLSCLLLMFNLLTVV